MKPEIKALRFTVPHKDIYYISWIIDAAEGIGFLQTDDAKAGRITVFTPVEQEKYILSLMNALRDEGIPIENEDCDEGTGEIKE
ncbi:DUF4911 domain-containing protein [Cloacibacillus sp. An23]|uniref:DUF4911 domain-containing protein n=1 Tax=Cloacibacillus sp. An23 TaxID=1965591 RepID=UPI000B36BDA3|nr:DUF4911 domain-containing protein [Cloacibacillus sp. An23]OUO92308.1 hypothetical protein B5F39_11820 [Cloacibacillus sp. An23]